MVSCRKGRERKEEAAVSEGNVACNVDAGAIGAISRCPFVGAILLASQARLRCQLLTETSIDFAGR